MNCYALSDGYIPLKLRSKGEYPAPAPFLHLYFTIFRPFLQGGNRKFFRKFPKNSPLKKKSSDLVAMSDKSKQLCKLHNEERNDNKPKSYQIHMGAEVGKTEDHV